jgi:hypothetical protein
VLERGLALTMLRSVTRMVVVVLGMGALVFGGARLALAAGSPAVDTAPTTTEPTPTPTPAPTPAPDPAPDPAPTPPKPKPAPHVSKPVTRTPTPAPKPAYRPPAVTPAAPPQAQVYTPPAAAPRVSVAPTVTVKPKVHRHAAKPKPMVHRHVVKPRRKPTPKPHPKVTRAAPAPPPVVAVEQSIASAPTGSVSSPWRRMLLWTLLAASVAGFGLAVLPTIVPRGLLAVEARLPLALLGTLLLVATAGVWLVGVR